MLALARFFIMGFVVLTVIYGALWFYLRARRRAMLELDWSKDSGQSQEAYVDMHMPEFDARRFRLLIGVVYILPICSVAAIFVTTNFF